MLWMLQQKAATTRASHTPQPLVEGSGWTWRAEVGSEGAPKPKPLKPFNVTFKTRLGKYVTMVSLCVLA